jgi:carboxymethylenebutenolidase
MGRNETLTAADGHRFSAYRAEPEGTPKGAIVVVQEIFGVNRHIRSLADGFAGDGYVAIAPALFDRALRGVELGYGDADRDRGRAIRAKVETADALKDVAACLAAVEGAGKVGLVGYCWGGTIAWAAAAGTPGLAACVSYYGGGVPGMVDLKPRCPVLFHFGETDASIPLDGVEAVRRAHPKIPIHVYPAGHGFACDERASWHAESARLARERTMAFFARHLA